MSNIEEQIKKEPVHAIMTLIMRLCNDEQKQVIYDKLDRRIDESPDLPTEQDLVDEAEEMYKIYEEYSASEKAVTTGLRKGYIEGRKKNIARIKELEAENERLSGVVVEKDEKIEDLKELIGQLESDLYRCQQTKN